MSSKYVIGVDIGTTSTKSVLFSAEGSVISRHGIEYSLFSPTPKRQNKIRKKFSALWSTPLRERYKIAMFSHLIFFAFPLVPPCTASLLWTKKASL